MSKTDTDMPKGFDCQCCKKHHVYFAYVFAHWDIELSHKCDACDAEHSILRGVAHMISFPAVEHDEAQEPKP